MESRYSIFVVPPFSQLGDITSFCVSGVSSPLTCRHLASQPWKFSGIVYVEVGSLLKVIYYGATSRHLSNKADIFPTTSQQPGLSANLPSSSSIFSCRQADICFCFTLHSQHRGKRQFHSELLRISLAYFIPFASEYSTSSISCHQVVRALKLPLLRLIRFLRKNTDESPSKRTSTSVPSEVRTSQFTNSLSPWSNESNHPEEDDVIFDDEKNPEEIAAAELRINRRRGYDPNSSLDENNTSSLSGVGSSVSSTPSLERAIKKKKVGI